MTIGQLYRVESEQLHSELYRLHADVAWGACKRIERAIEVLQRIERSNISHRAEAKARIAKFEKLREMSEALWLEASSLRSQLISSDGCDSSCQTKEARGWD